MIKSLILFLFFTCLMLILIAESHSQALEVNLMPLPARVELTGEKFRLTDSFRVAVVGETDLRLCSGATRALRRLAGRTGLFFPQDFITAGVAVDSANFIIRSQRSGKVALGEDETYSLVVSDSGIELVAETDIGALRGLETFLQLLSADDKGYYFPGARIGDEPRFPWRGLLLDVCRHFMPVEVVKRQLDAMAAVKLNVMHWHLSEDQGFRVESKIYPKLHELGSDGFYYTQWQIRDVIAYAAERGIRVIPEFDVPGHATAWLVGYPELASAPGPYTIERRWGIFYPVLNPASEFTYEFLGKLFGEMAALFPDPYFHIGGDEIEHADYHKAEHWNNNKEIQAFMKANGIPDNSSLQAYFNQRILGILTENGKIMVGWDEILHERMPTNIVIQSWRGRESMVKAAQLGYQSILSNGYYIDLIYPTSDHYLNDPLPADIALSEDEQKRILGGEATMWAEFVSPETVDSRIWPRTAAIAERLWSPREVNDLESMYRRLEVIRFQLEEHGLTHEKNYDMLLRRLTGYREIDVLKNFVDVVEPVKHYNRGAQRSYTSYSPLTRVVDAARPDAKVARDFRYLVDSFLGQPDDKEVAGDIKSWLALWKNNHAALLPAIRQSPILAEIESLSQDLAAISQIGLEAVKLIETDRQAEAGWATESNQAIEKAREPRGQVELMIASAIEKLVSATSSTSSNQSDSGEKSQ